MKQGKMRHRDSVGNEGVIADGGVQWMTAGRGIIHSEMPEQSEGLLWGYQLWVNLPAVHKMTTPRYQDIQADGIPETANAMAFIYEGEAISGARRASDHQLAILSKDNGAVSITAGDQGCGMLFMWGEPIGEPVAKMGPFVMNTREELFQAAEDFRAGRFA